MPPAEPKWEITEGQVTALADSTTPAEYWMVPGTNRHPGRSKSDSAPEWVNGRGEIPL